MNVKNDEKAKKGAGNNRQNTKNQENRLGKFLSKCANN